jgi:TonB family protein
MRWLRFAAFGVLVPLALFVLLASSVRPGERMICGLECADSTRVTIGNPADEGAVPGYPGPRCCGCGGSGDGQHAFWLPGFMLTAIAFTAPDLPFSSHGFVPLAERRFLPGTDSQPRLEGASWQARVEWPERARRLAIRAGWVLIEFDVSEAGAVENARVIEATPRGVFDANAVRAIERWRYRPAIEDGRAVARAGLRVRIRFESEGTES